MKKESILFGVIGLLLGGLIMMAFASNAVNSQNTGMMRMMGIGVKSNQVREDNEKVGNRTMMGMGSSMDDMMKSIEDDDGYEFDKAFIDAMIVHHEGAIRMAQQAEHKAQHQEIRDLAEQIIAAQTAEIEQMQQWKKDWLME